MTHENPMGLDGFEFVEFASHEPEKLAALFTKLHFTAIAKHRTKQVTLYRQGQVNFILNQEPDSYAMHFAKEHGPLRVDSYFRLKDESGRPARP